jgi:Sulfotransferase domain
MPLPNFIIVGAPKAGTTSIYAYLKRHPEVFMSERKEPHYFSRFTVDPEFDNFRSPVRDPDEYRELFRGSEGYKAIGEASSSYLSDEHAAMSIKSEIPHAKIVISLRNPVQRAYSHYLMELREGREARSFQDALAADQARAERGWGVSAQYVELGLYSEQVRRYISIFGRSNVLIVLFEDLSRDTAAVMHQVAEFLNIDPTLFPESAFGTVFNPFEASRGAFARWILRLRPIRIWSRRWIPSTLRRWTRSHLLVKKTQKPQMDIDVMRSLAKRFVTDLQELERIVGRDLGKLRQDS